MNTSVFIDLPPELEERQVTSLNGTWEIQEADMETGFAGLPEVFQNTIPVPGLWDMADKPISKDAAWYRKVFVLNGVLPRRITLKISKAFWGKYIYINGRHVCDHHPNFTPAYVDITAYVHPGENVLLIKTGALGTQDPALGHISGFDQEKYEYIPGIYDNVSLICSGNPVFRRLQVAPVIARNSVKVRLLVENLTEEVVWTRISLRICEAGTREEAARAVLENIELPAMGSVLVTEELLMENVRLWSPETPFLYVAYAKTEGDSICERFGMREFGFDVETKLPMLNGKPYYLRGNNILMYRFFEDPDRGSLPWDREWARTVLCKFKELNMNSIRFSICFPPELWYELADEMGFLIDDEYPIWLEIERQDGKGTADFLNRLQIPHTEGNPTWWLADHLDRKYPVFGEHLPAVEETLIPELKDWIYEHGNHPCVAIWDMQNETQTFLTEIIIKKLRESGADLSERPWDNGWAPPACASDSMECHPYLFKDPNFTLSDLNHTDRDPAVQTPFFYNYSRAGDMSLVPDNPRIINEYAWLWLNRKGEPTLVSKLVYEKLLPGALGGQYRKFYAKAVSQLTEFWRSGRKCAGVFYFCGLTYDKENAFACDAFLPDIAHPEYDPDFKKAMADAMAPLGICIEDWSEKYSPGTKTVPVSLYNDRDDLWSGNVRLSLMKGERELWWGETSCHVAPYGKTELSFDLVIPENTEENCRLTASYRDEKGEEIRSIREFVVE